MEEHGCATCQRHADENGGAALGLRDFGHRGVADACALFSCAPEWMSGVFATCVVLPFFLSVLLTWLAGAKCNDTTPTPAGRFRSPRWTGRSPHPTPALVAPSATLHCRFCRLWAPGRRWGKFVFQTCKTLLGAGWAAFRRLRLARSHATRKVNTNVEHQGETVETTILCPPPPRDPPPPAVARKEFRNTFLLARQLWDTMGLPTAPKDHLWAHMVHRRAP